MTNDMTLSIMLVEDNPLDVELTLRAFRSQNLQNPIVVARNGEEALEKIHRWDSGEPPPMLILLDLKLPKVDGIDVLRHLKSHPRFKSIPVLVLSTSKEDRDIRACYELGVNAYIAKPVSFDEFMEVVKIINMFWISINIPPPIEEFHG